MLVKSDSVVRYHSRMINNVINSELMDLPDLTVGNRQPTRPRDAFKKKIEVAR